MAGTKPGDLQFEQPHTTFPDAYQGTSVSHTFTFKNRGSRPVRITEGIALSGTGQVRYEPAVVGPGVAGTLHVSQPLASAGQQSYRFALVTDEPGVSRYRVSLSGFGESAYDPERTVLAFGTVDRSAGGSAQVELFSREVDALKIVTTEDLPPYLELDSSKRAGLDGEGVTLRVKLRPGAPLGLTAGRLRLVTNVPNQPRYELPYNVQAFDDVRPSQHPIAFDLVRAGEEKTVEILLSSLSGRALEVLSAEDPVELVSAEVLPCTPKVASCAKLRLTAYVEDLYPLEGVLNVKLKDNPETLPLRYVGWVISPETQVRTLDSSSPLTSLFSAPAPEPTPAPAKAISTPAVTPSPQPPPPATPNEVRLSWKAANEGTNYGYLVYRAERPEGPFRRVSRAIIPISSDPLGPQGHVYVDRDVQPGKQYYYYLDIVGSDGHKQRFSGVQARQVAGVANHP